MRIRLAEPFLINCFVDNFVDMITNEWINGKENIEDILHVRQQSGVCSSDADLYDEYAMHLVVRVDNMIASSGRLYVGDDNAFHISHVSVIPEFRHCGIGDLTVKLLLYKGFHFAETIRISVCRDMVSFFEPYGFDCVGGDDETAEMELSRDHCVYPSKCGNGGHV